MNKYLNLILKNWIGNKFKTIFYNSYEWNWKRSIIISLLLVYKYENSKKISDLYLFL
jgi:hypothetical protein